MNRLKKYLKATKGEMEHVSWPSRKQAIIFTLLVIAVSIVAALFLGFFDFIFSEVIVENIFL